jgi:general stress protein 26
VHETPEELTDLQHLLDDSARTAGSHLLSIITPERRLSAVELSRAMHGMRLLALATVTADGRPLIGPVDGYLIHGAWYFSSARDSVRMRHLASRPAVSATHLPREEFAVTVHGQADLFNVNDHYLPLQGSTFAEWLDGMNPVGARITATKMFVFHARNPDT